MLAHDRGPRLHGFRTAGRTLLVWPAVLAISGVLSGLSAAPVCAAAVTPEKAAPAKGKPQPAKAASKAAAKPAAKPPAKPATKKMDRPAAVAALAAKLAIGPGSVVADIGAGKGQDTWVFAGLVQPSGKVYAEEITDGLVKGLKAEAEKRKLTQVQTVLGREDDPALPPEAVDLAYMHYVYHHLSKPREMLRAIWRALKPGGYLTVVDRNRGTLRDWVPREQRKGKHFWLAETTVVREAREEGFAFVACAEECCESAEPFVLIFQRPKGVKQAAGDPDPFLPLAVNDVLERLIAPGDRYRRPAIIALGEARKLMGPILERSSGQGVEIVLEEWAAQKDERPPLPPGVSLPSVLTEQGDPHLGPEPIDAVFFLDSYHLLFHGKTLVAKLSERLAPGGRVWVLDREAKGLSQNPGRGLSGPVGPDSSGIGSRQPLSRREASHRRQIDPKTVKEEMAGAGFSLVREGPRPAPDRFLLIFAKTKENH